MIDIRELRIGNYIGYYSYNENDITIDKIKSIYFDDTTQIYMVELASGKYAHSNISLQGLVPISLTEEILLKCGMETTYNEILKSKEYQHHTNKFHLTICDYTNYRKWNVHIDNCDFQTIGSGECDYLHQLQNLVLDVTGTELEIKL
jgi:hypothetical protein